MKVDFKPFSEKEEPEKDIWNAKELIERKITKLPTLVDPIFPRCGSIALAGGSDLGKSTFLRQFALSVAIGDSLFLGWDLKTQHQRAIYVSTEDDKDQITISLKTFNEHRNLKSEKFEGVDFVFAIENLVETLRNRITINKIDVLIIDAFLDVFPGVMNDGGQVRRFITEYDQLAKEFGFLVIFNHHAGKRTQMFAPSKDNLLGSQSFEARMRLVIEMRPDFIDDNKLHLCIVKGNYLPPEYKKESFVIEANENRYFSNTGEREVFEHLRESVKEKQDLKKLCWDLKEEGKTVREIEVDLRSQGYKISKSTVNRYLKETE
jgi:KaiC/GvpD/RAD55 family RecA-like ATPase|tara:strand:+ start:2593 stop:3552 length:960 start_codon:yes stop_codon:yes gene_type:complete